MRTLGLIAVLAVAACSPSPPESSARDPINVTSFNIRYGTANDGDNSWEFRRDLVQEVILRYDPDVVGVQEALEFQVLELQAGMPSYRSVGVGRDDGRAAGEFAAIFYRNDYFEADTSGTFWLSETPSEPGSMDWGNRLPRICTWVRLIDRTSKQGLYVFNVHLDHESQPSRERSVELVAQRITHRLHDDPVILMGDFNAGDDNPAMQYLRGELARASSSDSPAPAIQLIDTFRELHPNAAESGTFGAWVGETSGERVDAIFVGGFEVLHAGIARDNLDGRYPSDHFPVTATVRRAR